MRAEAKLEQNREWAGSGSQESERSASGLDGGDRGRNWREKGKQDLELENTAGIGQEQGTGG